VGGSEEIAVDVRIIAATNRDLLPLIAAGDFREDLYYRLNVVPIKLPPLRDRADDVAPLALHFLVLAAKEGLPKRTLSEDAAQLLAKQPWRGNVRELQNLVYRAALLARDDVIDAEALRSLIDTETDQAGPAPGDNIADSIMHWLEREQFSEGELYHQALAELERPVFRHALMRTAGNQLKAAQLLGINRNTLRKRLSELGIDPDSFSRV
jgi:two-component system nitrogen regulation response regulator GlnG